MTLFCWLLLSFLPAVAEDRPDPHSFANSHEVSTDQVTLRLTVSFEKKELAGDVIHRLKRMPGKQPSVFVVDTRGLVIEQCSIGSSKEDFTLSGGITRSFKPVQHTLQPEDKILGSALLIPIEPTTTHVRIKYRTTPQATGLQWLTPAQTAEKKHPFLFSQSQAIHARSWVPVQDSPSVRFTYTASIDAPSPLQPVMSATRHEAKARAFTFRMEQPIPAYLLALAVGDLHFQPIGKRTGIWAEPSVVTKAAKEFEDMELMLEAVESLYGPYRWERYDVLMLPPSFPFGGMENPRMTFATPTVLAGDKSLVSLIAHEMAHSWSGNLVTNATWRDFWLNEGFTVYLERRILEKVYGKARAEMETQIGRNLLEKSLKTMKPREQVLHIDLTGQDPDDNVTDIPYEKGFLFLLHLEKLAGRERFDAFLKGWFSKHAFQSVTTPVFVAYLKKELLDTDAELANAFPLDEWISKPGLPAGIPTIVSPALSRAELLARDYAAGKVAATELKVQGWSTQEWLYFLRSLPEKISREKLQALDKAHHLTQTGNSEVLCQWLELAIKAQYEAAYPRVESFLLGQGRRIYVKPLYEAMLLTPEGKARALAIYQKARPRYHSITTSTLDALLK
ncbi:MAG TPA: M1 family metallopeptidase [Gemmatales bacterium]|nr:M1 family metallopeptidase [Gemmatales bacterium]